MKVLKRVLGVFLAVLIVATYGMKSISSYAMSGYVDVNHVEKKLFIYVLPYDGLTVDEAFPTHGDPRTKGSMKNSILGIYGYVYEKGSSTPLDKTDVLKAGKTYHYVLLITDDNNDEADNVYPGKYTVTILNGSDSSDTSCFSNFSFKCGDYDGYTNHIECDVTIQARPNYNLGSCYVNLPKEGGELTTGGDIFNRNAGPIFNSLSYALGMDAEDDKINEHISSTDEGYTYFYDLDNDGSFDIKLFWSNSDRASFSYLESLTVLDSCSVKGKYEYTLSDEDKRKKDSVYIYYYDKITLDFAPEETPSVIQNNTENKTSNNLENTANNNAADSNASNNASNNNAAGGNAGNTANNQSSDAGNQADNSGAGNAAGVTYENEWVNGQWYGSNGDASYTAEGSWKANSTGWWFEDTAGWYPQSQWVKIDGKWYYFTADGYMDYSEYRDGYWLGADGAWVEGYENGTWHVDSTGWWFEDNGWYPANQYLWINGTEYYFDSKGYMK